MNCGIINNCVKRIIKNRKQINNKSFLRNFNRMIDNNNKRTITIESVEPRKYIKNEENNNNDNNNKKFEQDSIDKLSNVILSDEQMNVKEDIIKFVKESIKNYQKGDKPRAYVIKGGAGTGKSVVLNNLFNEIQKISREDKSKENILKNSKNYLLVNHPEMIRLYHRIAKSFPYLNKKDIERPTSYINQFEKNNNKNELNDLIIIDEAHLLSTCKNAYKRFFGNNHLIDIMKTCKVIVIVYDDKQTLRTDQYWEEDNKDGCSLELILNKFSKDFKIIELKEQFRMKLKNSINDNSDILNWIKNLCFNYKIKPIPKERLNKESNFEFKIFKNCQEMYQRIIEKNEKYGQCRILSTYDYPYRISGNKEWYVTGSGGFKLRWDKFTPGHQVPWSERDYTIKEVGSVYTIQGFDLNYVGVIIGPSIKINWDKNEISIDISKYEDKAGSVNKNGIKDRERAVKKIIMNSLYVLLTRGVRGLYVYVSNEEGDNGLE